jgi:hypothetical protein
MMKMNGYLVNVIAGFTWQHEETALCFRDKGSDVTLSNILEVWTLRCQLVVSGQAAESVASWWLDKWSLKGYHICSCFTA